MFSWPKLGWGPVLQMLTGHYGDHDLGVSDLIASFDVRVFAAQQFTLWTAAYVSGRLVRRTVRSNQWDLRWLEWRSASEWYYLLSGEVTKFPESKVAAPKTKDFLTWVDVLTSCGGRLLLYSGVMASYNLNERGGLESVYLLEPWVREFERVVDEGKPLAEGRSIVPHSVFVIGGNAILNMNVVYQPIPPGSKPADILTEASKQQPTEPSSRVPTPPPSGR